MKELKVYRCEVDLFRNNGFVFRTAKDRLYQRDTKGVYFVCAKSEKEAKQLLQNHIRFGSITIPKCQASPDEYKDMKYKEIRKETPPKR